ncbi:hypothetical protein M3Y99_01466600 [Aphelenchoides fujianensis]|nr:hypothetical protein M3Y99_01466600 [Aphelenchoides fujianensis]
MSPKTSTSGPLVPARPPPTSRPLSFPQAFRSFGGGLPNSRPSFSPSTVHAESSRYAPLPPLPMNPNDSPRRVAYGEPPQSSAAAFNPMIASPVVSRREFAGFAPHPQQGKMLLDPQTGQQEWWGEEDEPKPKEDRTPTRNSNEAVVKPSASAPKLESPTAETPRSAAANAVVQKAIRMDFDLKTAAANVEQQQKQEPKASTPRVAPTAFTVNFDAAEKPKRGKPALSSEATNRRLARRSVPPTRFRDGAPLPAAASNSSDPKRYLLSKMLQGFGHEDGDEAEEEDEPRIGHDATHHEIDAISDAGTYVIEGKSRLRREQRAQSRPVDTQSSSSSSSDSTATNPTTQRSSTAAPPSSRSTPLNSARVSSAGTSSRPAPTESPHFAMRRSLMKDLQALKAQNQPKTTAAAAPTTPKARSLLDPSKSSRLGVTPSPRPCQTTAPVVTPQRPATTSTAGGIRRSDGGRFSMRTGLQNAPTAASSARPSTVKNPPFRAGIAPTKKGGNVESPEMAAWLRRKTYDPVKAAAEARTKQQLKTRGDNFFSTRSVSYNQPNNSTFNRLLRPIGDERSNKSQDDLFHLTEELDDFSLGGSNSNLNRTVDELTQKCQRSMQLLKLCNPNAMTESVEQLLDQMVEERSEDGDDPMNRLERLNDAFGALQKCLEDSNRSRNSPAARPANISATLKQTILSPMASAPPAFAPAADGHESDGSPTSF